MRRLLFHLGLALPVLVLAPPVCEAAQPQTIPSAQVVTLLQKGQSQMRTGDVAGAETTFREAVRIAPTLSDTHLGLGLVELRRGELDDAVTSLAKAAQLNPQLRGVHLFLGIAEYQTGKAAEAAAALRQEIALDPHNAEALTWLGIVELDEGHPEQATSPLDQAAELNPKDPNVLFYQGRAHTLVAQQAYTALYQLDPDSVLVHRALAETLAGSGQPEKSIAEYEAAIRKEPNNADLYESLGEQNQKLSRYDAARDAYSKELELNPNSAIALYNLGKIDVEHGKPEEGVAILRKAAAAHARLAPTDFYLGYGLAQVGQNEEAAHWLEQSIASEPSAFIAQSAYFQLARVYQHLGRKEDAQRALDTLKKLKAQAAPGAASTPAPGGAESTGKPPLNASTKP